MHRQSTRRRARRPRQSVIAVNAASQYHTLAELIDAARAKPRQLTIASVGPATPIHLGTEMLMQETGVDMTYVPFKGDAPTVTANT